ncbi:MAG: CBS domain-containing protein [Phycisphaeraceae bacterium]|nr:CBS domain-containing protein [Phycisphaeraceae bacterium]
MARVQSILEGKDGAVLSIGPKATVLEAAHLMNQRKIGALVVTLGGEVAGIITERDVLVRVVGEQRHPAQTLVEDVMSTHVTCCTPDTSIEEARTLMRDRRIRHLPVVDKQKHLRGMISIGDLNAWQIDGHEQTIHDLHQYIHGRA